MSGVPEALARRIRSAVAARREELVELAAALVRLPSTLGHEEPAQALVEARLRDIGFQVERVRPDPEQALRDPKAGYPPLPYDGRSSVVGRLPGGGKGRSFHLSGHVDVVPVERPDLWERDPWGGEVEAGRIWGRGAGDMKAGLAAYLVAAAVVAELCPDRRGELIFSSVIEEECGGNGMWSVLRAGFDGDATLIGESTELRLAHAGTGVVWARLSARGTAGHAMAASQEGPFDRLCRAVAALRLLERELNDQATDPVFLAVRARPYGMTIGRIEGGVWTSSTPHELAAGIRFGFGPETRPQDVQERIRTAVGAASPDVEVVFEAFRAHAYSHVPEGPLADAVAAAHRRVIDAEVTPVAFTATTDARFVAGPCFCYGPAAGDLHGANEWVDIETAVRTAEVVALTVADWTS